MFHSLLKKLDQASNFPQASAHCDIPCKIYDPSTAQLAALSVIRFIDLINELDVENPTLAQQAQLARLVAEKETHAEKVKHEVRVIWGDYFKAPQFEQFPNTNDLVHRIMLEGSKCRQTVERDHAEQLLALVNEFAASYWATKGVETFTATCPYPPALPVVYPKLG